MLEREYDASSVSGTQRFVQKKFDASGRETFTSYPQATFTSVLNTVNGRYSSFDPLGRPKSTWMNSELGNLTGENGVRFISVSEGASKPPSAVSPVM